MDRNGKKPKAAVDPSLHPERSDTKANARDTLAQAATDARLERERTAASDAPGSRGKGGRR